jgi:hypothetical protein
MEYKTCVTLHCDIRIKKSVGYTESHLHVYSVLLYIVLHVSALQKVIVRYYNDICIKSVCLQQDKKSSVRGSVIITFVLWKDGKQYRN